MEGEEHIVTMLQHICNSCGVTFKQHSDLQRHVSSIREGKKLNSPYCDTALERRDNLLRHIKSKLSVLEIIEPENEKRKEYTTLIEPE